MKSTKTKNLFFSVIALLISAIMFSVGCDDSSSIYSDSSLGAFSKINHNIVSVYGVTASSYEKGNKPENTIDVDFSSKWSAKGSSEWIKYDLGVSKNIESVDIFFSNKKKMDYRFSIDLSLDGEDWEYVYNGRSRNDSEGFENFAFDSTLARYVRIKGYNNYKKENVEIAEVEINAVSETDDCKYGEGKEEYEKEYNSREKYLEYTWKSYGCDDIDKFIKDTKKDISPTGYCGEKAFKKATKKVISKIEKECEEDVVVEEDPCKYGEGKEEYKKEYDSRKSELGYLWKAYSCDEIDDFKKDAKRDTLPTGICAEKAFEKATKKVISEKEKECEEDVVVEEDDCKSGEGKEEYTKEYNSRVSDLKSLWKSYSCDDIDQFIKKAKRDKAPFGKCGEKAFEKATRKVISSKEKECDDNN